MNSICIWQAMHKTDKNGFDFDHIQLLKHMT